MFKRSTKITSLLVAAASVATMVPAMAADVKKVENYDGTVYNAIPFADGKFYIDGDLEDEDEGAFYVSDGKYTELEDVDSGDEVNRYGTKYVEIEDGDYYLDLETGKVTDDAVREDAQDDASSNTRKKIKKDNDGRYKDATINWKDDNGDTVYTSFGDDQLPAVKAINKNLFEESWYETQYTADSYDLEKETTNFEKNGGAESFTVYTDEKGNYIDADYNLGKVNVVTRESITLKNTNDDDNGYRAAITHGKTIASDKNYIYRLAWLDITKDGRVITEDVQFGSSNKKIDVTTTAGSELGSGDVLDVNAKEQRERVTSIPVIQKISKEQASDDVDGAKYAKTVNTYFLTDDSGKLKEKYRNWSVVDGKLVNYQYEDGKVYAQAITLKSKNGYYYTDFSDGADCDVESSNAYGVDKDGKLYVLDSGYIKEFDNDEDFDKVYKVDGACDELEVYDKDNMVAWNEADEVYSIIGGKSATEETTTDAATTTGWVQDATTGNWSYVKADGTKAIGWLQSPASGVWYYMDATGNMLADGWVQDAGTWYFLDATGAMKTGWVYTGGAWYYLASNGAMKTGWVQTAGKWYFLDASGAMLANTTVGGYVLGADGAWIK